MGNKTTNHLTQIPLLSFIVLTHNRTDHFKRWSEYFSKSLMYYPEAFKFVELIICQDKTSDTHAAAVENIVAKMANQFPDFRIRLLDSSIQLGQSKNVNRAFKEVEGKFLHIFHDDDLVRYDYFQKVLPLLELEESDIYCLSPNLVRNRFSVSNSFSKELIDPRYLATNLLPVGTYVPSCVIFKNIRQIDLTYSINFDFVCDWEHFTRLLIAAQESQSLVTVIKGGIVFYDTGTQGITSSIVGIIRHFIEHVLLQRTQFLSLRLQNDFYFTESEIENFLSAGNNYRETRFTRDLEQVKIKHLLGVSFWKIVRSELSKKEVTGNLLFTGMGNIRNSIRSLWLKHVLLRALRRINLIVMKPFNR